MPDILKCILAIVCILAIPFVLMTGMADVQAEREKVVTQARMELTGCTIRQSCYVRSLGTYVSLSIPARVKEEE